MCRTVTIHQCTLGGCPDPPMAPIRDGVLGLDLSRVRCASKPFSVPEAPLTCPHQIKLVCAFGRSIAVAESLRPPTVTLAEDGEQRARSFNTHCSLSLPSSFGWRCAPSKSPVANTNRGRHVTTIASWTQSSAARGRLRNVLATKRDT